MRKKNDSLSTKVDGGQFDPARPYNDLPPLPPAADIETKAILKACVEARASLAALQQAAKLIPNQDILINSIPLREAKDSSEIENIVTTNDKLFQFANADPGLADTNTKETLRYRTALLRGFDELKTRPLTVRTAIEVCRIIKGTDLDVRKTSGTALLSANDRRVVYTPPEGAARIREKLSNWERYLHEATKIDPVIRMAVGHYQFEAIHPFPDGNGRTGRILNILFLVEQGLLDLPILYLSQHINANRPDYYRLLLGVTVDHAWEAYILFMLAGVHATSDWARHKIVAIKYLMDETVRHVSEARPKIYTYELLMILFKQPYCRISDVVGAQLANRTTASKYLKELAEAGVLEPKKVGREQLYLHTKLLQLLISDEHQFEPYR